jgi:beta-glucosidase
VRDLQRYLREETRPGIPALVREESVCGYAGPGGTTFPQAIGMASTWDPALVESVADAVSGQLRAVGCTATLSPVADLGREPRWGRIEETYGEDAHLAARLATATVEGLQRGPDAVLATLKHFVGHGRPAGGRNCAPATPSLRAMRDADCVPFRAAIEEAAPSAVMAAYHAVDGVPCHASARLLTDLLRDEWGFAGTVVSDGRGIEQLSTVHRVASDRRVAGVQALRAGVDVELPETTCFGDRLVAAVREGDVEEAVVDRSVRRHLREKARLGLLADPTAGDPEPRTAAAPFERGAVRDLARTAARRSLVLLANDGTLPLSPPESVAVVGPSADAPRNLLGDYAYGAAESMVGAGAVVTPLAGVRDRLGPERVTHARGCRVRDDASDADGEERIAEAVEVAAAADVAVVCVGGRSGIDVERDSTGTAGEGLDRATLTLPGRQRALVRAVAAVDTPLVAVLINGRPLATPTVAAAADALVEAWLPGQEGGHAVADVLFGAEPGGRLPVSIPRSVGQLPVHYARARGPVESDYVFDDGTPLYPFGHGESYAQVEYESLSLGSTTVAPGGTVTAAVTVRNTADVAGEEVVQVYASDREASVVRPVRELVGFRRLSLDAGARATVVFELAAEQFAFHDRGGDLVLEPGAVDVEAGRSAGDRRLTGTVTLVGNRTTVADPAFFPDVTVRWP